MSILGNMPGAQVKLPFEGTEGGTSTARLRRRRKVEGLCWRCKRSDATPIFKGGLCERHYRADRERDNATYQRTKGQSSARSRRRRYGIGPAEYQERLQLQGGACAICRRPETSVGGRRKTPLSLAVDHDHQDGRVRGLLCSACNRGLAAFEDDPERMIAAAEYLKSK